MYVGQFDLFPSLLLHHKSEQAWNRYGNSLLAVTARNLLATPFLFKLSYGSGSAA